MEVQCWVSVCVNEPVLINGHENVQKQIYADSVYETATVRET